jgi:RNA polymerase sigma factor for flagellar operon FliA
VDVKELDNEALDHLVVRHEVLVKRIAYHLLGRLPKTIQLDDLIQAGMLGLLEASRHYDPSKGASFETYAGIRIKGHMLDEVRQNDWVPRSVYRNARLISEATRQKENQLGRVAKDNEIAEALGISTEEYHEMQHDSATSNLYAFEDLGVEEDALHQHECSSHLAEPHIKALQHDLMTHLKHLIDQLPAKERMSLILYYERDLNLKEIASILEVGESRVSQILSQAVHRIQGMFRP